jgi:hypothetical protein
MDNFTPITVGPKSTLDDRKFALTQIYQQVLERQPYKAERKAIATLEKDFLSGKIGVRRFLKDFACTELYLNEFYYCVSNTKFMDVCFKHFLGRAIANQDEMRFYNKILTQQGVHHLVIALLDSEEYRKVFGCFTVPYARKQRCYSSPEAFLETKFLIEEHFGQRGWSIPTIYWRQLGMICTNGVCQHPEAFETLTDSAEHSQSLSPETLIKLLKAGDVKKAKELIVGLSPKQREMLKSALH